MNTQIDARLLPRVRPVVVTAALILIGTLVLSLLLYHQGASTVSAGAIPTARNSQVPYSVLLQEMDRLALRQIGATAAGGVVLTLVVGVGLAFWRRTFVKKLRAAEAARQEAEQRLRDQTEAEKERTGQTQRLEQELARVGAELDRRVAERTASLARTCEALQKELNDRKQAERTMTQQTNELVRSKDVLELHVQARTHELQRLQRLYESILNSAGEGIYGLDLRGRTTFVNLAAARLTGWDAPELVGKLESEVFNLKGTEGDGSGVALATDPQGNPLAEQTFCRKDGSSFTVEYVRTPIRENNRLAGAVVVFKDITERKQAEETLNRKAAELARSNAELEQFAYVASHDLQEPLRKIQAFGDRLKAKCDAVQLQDGRDFLDRMQSAASRMQNLINDLLTFSRVISNTQPFVPVDLNVVVKEVLGDLEVRMEKTKAQLEVGQLPTIEADPMQMRQLMQNLIGNALKFQPPGGVPRIQVRSQIVKNPLGGGDSPIPEETCELTIQDNGIGFEEKYVEKIFAVFQRLHGRSEYEGTGVGLAVCRRITDRHGGTIRAQGELGKGATFTVSLPVRRPKRKEVGSEQAK